MTQLIKSLAQLISMQRKSGHAAVSIKTLDLRALSQVAGGGGQGPVKGW